MKNTLNITFEYCRLAGRVKRHAFCLSRQKQRMTGFQCHGLLSAGDLATAFQTNQDDKAVDCGIVAGQRCRQMIGGRGEIRTGHHRTTGVGRLVGTRLRFGNGIVDDITGFFDMQLARTALTVGTTAGASLEQEAFA